MSGRAPGPFWLLPASILIGCMIIGAGLYFGLRASAGGAMDDETQVGIPPVHKARSSTAVPLSASSEAPSSAPESSSEPHTVREADATLINMVTHAAQAALDEKKPDLARRCYVPAIAKAPEPAKAAYAFDVTFGPDGKPIAFGISDVREALREDVSSCLRRERIELSVDPPGAHVRTQLTLSFP